MLTVAALMVLQLGLPNGVRLVDDPGTPLVYEQMTRREQFVEFRALEAQRPGLWFPGLVMTGGVIGAAVSFGVFWSMFSTPFGLPVYLAVTLVAIMVVSLAAMAGSLALWVRTQRERDVYNVKLERLSTDARDGLCRSVPGEKPCMDQPGPVRPGPNDDFGPQLRAPAPEPSAVIARF